MKPEFWLAFSLRVPIQLAVGLQGSQRSCCNVIIIAPIIIKSFQSLSQDGSSCCSASEVKGAKWNIRSAARCHQEDSSLEDRKWSAGRCCTALAILLLVSGIRATLVNLFWWILYRLAGCANGPLPFKNLLSNAEVNLFFHTDPIFENSF